MLHWPMIACKSKIAFNKLRFVPKHYALHGYLIKQGLYLVNTEPIKFPLLLAPYSRKTPCSWSSVHLPNYHPIKDGWQLTPTTHQIICDYYSKLYVKGKGTTFKTSKSLTNLNLRVTWKALTWLSEADQWSRAEPRLRTSSPDLP